MRNFIKQGIILLLCLYCANSFAQTNYGEALQKSLFFYEAQQSGELPSWNRVSWRADSALGDGSDIGIDLTGGWYDAGDHVKFGFPMAYSVTTLAWGGIEYKDAYKRSGQMDILKQNLRFVTDYFIKCHTAPNEFYGQLGNGSLDHSFWGAPEVMVMDRPAYKIDANNPGSDLAAETAAALAATSILFQDSDPTYSATLLTHAIQLYDFADTYRGIYSESITDAAGFYRSYSGYNDELVWGATWLYRATNDATYLSKAELAYDNLGNEGQSSDKAYKFTMSWDDKSYGSYVLLAQLTGTAKYMTDAERFLDFWTSGVNGETVTYSPGGQAHLIQWGSLRYAANTAFLAFVYSDKVSTSAANKLKYHDFAVSQTNYALGDNPLNRSFMVGFGNNPANNPHHRSSHGPWANSLQGSPEIPSHTLFGALAGGPKDPDDQFVDDRGDYIANEVACDYNACFTGNLVRMYDEFGGEPLANFPIDETPSRTEIRSFSKFNSDNAYGSTVKVLIQNRTAWPARVTDNLSYRYFFDISEGVAQGYTIDDYDITLNSVQGNSTSVINAWDAVNNIYYMEVSLAGEEIAPIGDPQFRRETQINLRVQNGVPYDTSNDWSAQGLNSSTDIESVNIPVYDNGVLVFGNEPIPGSGVNGGTITGGPFTFTVGDDIADHVSGITLSGNVGENSQWVVTDNQNNIVALPITPEDVNFDTETSGISLIWHLSYNDAISGLAIGNNTSGLTGDFNLSNTISVIKITEGSSNDCSFGTPLSTSLPNINSAFTNIHVLGNGGPNLDNVTIFTINWDLNNNGLYQFSINTNNGTPNWYVDLRGSLTFSFNSTQPDATFSGTGITGLDGAYWVTVDAGNFVMVSKTDGFTLYFSNTASEPICISSVAKISEKTISEASQKIESVSNPIQTIMQLSPNPAHNSVTLSSNDSLQHTIIHLVSLTGRVMMSDNIDGIQKKTTINLEGLQSGVYILKVHNTKTGIIMNKKIIKK
ncbi:glycoside hydrolase family 9 protein [Flavivirga jejuensis]|uniref:Endoglucanase n=1 Tax=Flavivirga jejuensis TaxID=870487 RepID=A0ABT8WSR7_9FLAO|nr:glycoside hydrolase family 9 protein [Flavivirga jejuensis]MDO5976154.1 glycoside hydrolase family 9 protein [Flavivirga jejuensis]